MPPSTKGPQPIKAVLALRYIQQTQLARDPRLLAALHQPRCNGYINLLAELKARLAEYLDGPGVGLVRRGPREPRHRIRRRTTADSHVPERLEDPSIVARVADVLRACLLMSSRRDNAGARSPAPSLPPNSTDRPRPVNNPHGRGPSCWRITQAEDNTRGSTRTHRYCSTRRDWQSPRS